MVRIKVYLVFALSFITSLFRYIDGHHDKINIAVPSVKIPNVFYYSAPFKCLLDKSGHIQRKLHHLEKEKLAEHAEKLEKLAVKKYASRSIWKEFMTNVGSLRESFTAYSNYLWQKNIEIDERRISGPSRNETLQLTTVKPAEMGIFKVFYEALDRVLINSDFYEPVDLSCFAPFERRKKFRWISNIRISVRIQVYKLKRGQAAFAWRIPESVSNVQNLNVVKQVDEIVNQQYMAKVAGFLDDRFKNQREWSNDDALSIYDVAACDLPENQYEELRSQDTANEIIESIEFGENITDLVQIQHDDIEQTRTSKFDHFWAALQDLIDEHVAVADERRHGTVNCVSPLCVSIRDLIEQTRVHMIKKYPEAETQTLQVPSLEWVRRQFHPRKENSRVGRTFTRRFNLKWVLQRRLQRKSHPDHHYGAKNVVNFKMFAAM